MFDSLAHGMKMRSVFLRGDSLT
ncbi:uncharacterized protein [Blastocystis hominis]|uniref:Uncharacterized protein n=1 Tax=Blastocystis hominis TaxID=12968 RepID=D8LXC7_BLAHO|nr:uncharacterized protein [Blastocystis hominis]CBK20922.2 unnamed protein product [Blastocystis hominis]|eukprot:XP_012894970.1 uncharacterized protein [Blastocystis hominis]